MVKRTITAACAAAFLLVGLAGCPSVPPAPIPYTDPEALYQLVSGQTAKYLLVDVRTNEEYVSGHIPTAVSFPYDAIGENPPTPNKAALIIVYCQSGARAARAKKTLDSLGYINVVDFGAIGRWTHALVEGADPGTARTNTQ